MIAVVAAVRGEIEGHAKTHLSRFEVAAVERIAVLGGAETRVLPDGPRSYGVHAGVGTAQVGWNAGAETQVFHTLQIDAGVERLQRDLFAVGQFGGDALIGTFIR